MANKNSKPAADKEAAAVAETAVAETAVAETAVAETAVAETAAVDPTVDDNGLDPAAKKAPEDQVSVDEGGVKKYVTTPKVRVNGRTLRDPKTNITYTPGIPTYGDAYPGSWLEAQVKAGLLKLHGE